MASCPLCDMECKHGYPERSAYHDILCPRCGDYSLSGKNHSLINDIYSKHKYILSGYSRYQKEQGHPMLNFDDVDIQNLIKKYSNMKVNEKTILLLKILAHKTATPGHSVQLNESRDITLGYCKDDNEFRYHLEYLRRNKFIQNGSHVNRDGFTETVSHEGWMEIEKNKKIQSNNIFIARSFGEKLIKIRNEVLMPAVKDAGYTPVDMQELEHNDRIDDRIIIEINKSKLLIADTTEQKHGVYFEAGYCLGQNKEVIWCCNNKEIDEDNNHFDTRQFNHIVWEYGKLTEFKERLKNRIIRTIGYGENHQSI